MLVGGPTEHSCNIKQNWTALSQKIQLRHKRQKRAQFHLFLFLSSLLFLLKPTTVFISSLFPQNLQNTPHQSQTLNDVCEVKKIIPPPSLLRNSQGYYWTTELQKSSFRTCQTGEAYIFLSPWVLPYVVKRSDGDRLWFWFTLWPRYL